MKNTKKSLFLSALSLLLCVTMLVGATFAWFTDSVTSGKNRITAGNLDIDVLHTNAKVTAAESVSGKTDLFRDVNGNEMKWEPGVISYENFTVKNMGTLALKYDLAMNILSYNTLNGKSLKEVLKVKVLTGDDKLASPTRESVAALDWDTTDTLDVFKNTNALEPSAEDNFQVIVYWEPTDSDNNYNVNNGKTTSDGQPLYVEFGINVVATQKDSESDSFDNTYDVGTYLPSVVTKSVLSGTDTVLTDTANDITVTAPAGSTDATVLTLYVEPTDKPGAITVADNQVFKSVEVTLKDQNGTKVTATGSTLYIAEMNVGANHENLRVYHNDAQMTEDDQVLADHYTYEKATGKVTMYVNSFSPFTSVYDVTAQVGTEKYEALADAFTAALASDGSTVKLLADAELANTVTVDKNLTVDLNGKTVTVTTTGYAFDVTTATAGKTLTVTGGTFSGINNPKGVAEITLNSATADLVFTDVDIYGATASDSFTTNYGLIADNSGTNTKDNDTGRQDTITLTNVNVRTAGDIITGTNGRAYASVNVTGGTYFSGARGFRFCGASDSTSVIDGANITVTNGIAVYSFSDTTLKNTVINMTATGNNDAVAESGAYNTGATLTVENTTVTANGTAASAIATESMGKVVVTSGTFVNNNTGKYVAKVSTSGGYIVLNGGTFGTQTQGASQTCLFANTQSKSDDAERPSVLEVNGGTYYGGADFSSDSARVEINGGTFKNSIHFYGSGNSYVKLMPDNTAVFEDGYTEA